MPLDSAKRFNGPERHGLTNHCPDIKVNPSTERDPFELNPVGVLKFKVGRSLFKLFRRNDAINWLRGKAISKENGLGSTQALTELWNNT